MVLHGGIVHMIALFGLFLAPSFELAGLCLVLVSAVNPFQRVGITALSLTSTEDPGAILGLGQTATSLARMLAPVMAGAAQTISDDGPALLGSFSALVAIICTIFLIPSDLTPAPNPYVKEKTT
ncbi:unnamed protein product [Allacma fusca]|uniref:Uncharacterized protein n=1 Tax=Allacma fusca TaxID=39272 RepID=A0A8J2PZQ7_9HEXA|nr:unnamed protein product [Allacma fusca]